MRIKAPFMVHSAGNTPDSPVTLSAYKQAQFKNCPTSTKPGGVRTVFGYFVEAFWIPNVTKPQTNAEVLAERVQTVQTESEAVQS